MISDFSDSVFKTDRVAVTELFGGERIQKKHGVSSTSGRRRDIGVGVPEALF